MPSQVCPPFSLIPVIIEVHTHNDMKTFRTNYLYSSLYHSSAYTLAILSPPAIVLSLGLPKPSLFLRFFS
jgi:hypothetical protein